MLPLYVPVLREDHHMCQLNLVDPVDERLDRLIALADQTGYTLDALVQSIGRIDQRDFDAASDNPSLLPRYMKSSVTP